jgi:hypothetical protein
MKRVPRGEVRSVPKRRIEVDATYLQAVKKLESLPENRSGADKTWVERAMRSWQRHYARAAR